MSRIQYLEDEDWNRNPNRCHSPSECPPGYECSPYGDICYQPESMLALWRAIAQILHNKERNLTVPEFLDTYASHSKRNPQTLNKDLPHFLQHEMKFLRGYDNEDARRVATRKIQDLYYHYPLGSPDLFTHTRGLSDLDLKGK